MRTALSHTHVLVDTFFSYPVAPGWNPGYWIRGNNILLEKSQRTKRKWSNKTVCTLYTQMFYSNMKDNGRLVTSVTLHIQRYDWQSIIMNKVCKSVVNTCGSFRYKHDAAMEPTKTIDKLLLLYWLGLHQNFTNLTYIKQKRENYRIPGR